VVERGKWAAIGSVDTLFQGEVAPGCVGDD